ncbi:Nif3-like dinuclear metal center hexameric protein [Stratiformator vulcanicus]|uniref:GTP cyclohydrolase 1 type 2 homolog n=1 Tax=Stratiformator vulcanicus TaxID=2527980 RepID=A0A517R3V8_9PLAN|nr:Nif3-like dinuclear metal center hexameric protein [Stratiformator vulcanicus]QDT38537.1 GTP cyclohydrolase 1 type 2 [Stratiformator vulcanicus]
MPTVHDLRRALETIAPPTIAEDWDNVGLLLGDPEAEVNRVLTCLTLTPDVAAEAVEDEADLIVTHHPIFFRGTKRITTETSDGAMILKLARAGVAVYSPHTSYDSGPAGINRQIANRLGLDDVRPLRVIEPASTQARSASKGPTEECRADLNESTNENQSDPAELGAGRYGVLNPPLEVHEFLRRVKVAFGIDSLRHVPADTELVGRVAIACGSAGEFLSDASAHCCQYLLTGETSFHTCLEARAAGMGLILLGHYRSERFAMDRLAEMLSGEFPEISATSSHAESDPITRS